MTFANLEIWSRGTAEEILAKGNALGLIACPPPNDKEEFARAKAINTVERCIRVAERLLSNGKK